MHDLPSSQANYNEDLSDVDCDVNSSVGLECADEKQHVPKRKFNDPKISKSNSKKQKIGSLFVFVVRKSHMKNI